MRLCWVGDCWWRRPGTALPGASPLQIGWVWAIYWGFKAYGPLGEGGEQ